MGPQTTSVETAIEEEAMTPIKWVESGFVLDHVDKLRCAHARQRGMLPVLTLDQIEAWLHGNKFILNGTLISASQNAEVIINARNGLLEELLAQVWAWKEKP